MNQRTDVILTEQQQDLVNRLAHRIVRLGLATVAILFIESARPLNFIGSQLLHFLSPFVLTFGQFPDYKVLSSLMEDRRCVDALLEAIEQEEERFELDRSS